MNIPCFLIPIIVGLISALLGYLLGKMMSGGGDANLKSQLEASNSANNKLNSRLSLLESDLASARSGDIGSLQAELDACKANTTKLNATISSLHTEIDSIKAKHSSTQSFTAVSDIPIPFDADFAASVYGKKIKQDDLKIVEGIGPKIEELYHNAGITTWKALSETSLEKSQSILNEAGERFAMHNPSTWAKQCLLAYQGKWKELKDWQESLDGGKE
jgi:predicted flap endonuclease-1-like 5' DNA nuclease